MNFDIILNTLVQGSMLLAQAESQTPAQAEPDFRGHVWLAYGFVIALLALFTMFVLFKLGKTQQRIDHLTDRFDKVHPSQGNDSNPPSSDD